MSSRCCLKMQSMKVLLPRPLKVTANLSRATLSRSVKSKNQAHISWESCCASPRASLCVCVPAHLIYKRSIEICMSPMMPALKIHSNREYIDSYVIELSLSFLCHGSHGSLSGLMYYRKHAAPLPLSLSATHGSRPLSHSHARSVALLIGLLVKMLLMIFYPVLLKSCFKAKS